LNGRAQRFWAELKRRKVVRVAVAYMVTAAGVMGAADAFGEALHLPPWALTAVALTLAIGLPVALVLAWAFDITRDAPDPATAPFPDSSVPQSTPSLPPRPALAQPSAALVGRETELAEAVALLDRPDCRLLTLTGPAGIGKTRLAQEIALQTAAARAHGACFVPLAGVEHIDDVPAAIADALELPLTGKESPLRQLTGFLHEKQLLLVLDNFEHLLPGAALLTDILERTPGLRVLVTCQRRLRIAGETVLALDALPVPQQGAPLEDSAAAVLFLQVAQRNDPHFQPVTADAEAIGRICRVVGGIPLAVELAAAWVGPLSCQEIAEGLEQHHAWLLEARRDLPPRHQSLNAAFAYTWRLLDTEEQEAFRRLCVLKGSFDLQAAVAVAGADLRLLARLVEASLLKRLRDSRYDVLPVLRAFGEEKLAENETELNEVRSRHAHHFLARLEAFGAPGAGAERDAVAAGLAACSADIRAAWLHAADHPDHAGLERGAPGLYQLLEVRGRSAEGAELFQRAVAAVRPAAAAEGAAHGPATAALTRLLPRAAGFLGDLGRIFEAGELLAEALPLLRARGDRAELAFALSKHSHVLRAVGDYRAPEFEEALALYRELGDARGIAGALNGLGAACHALGEYQEAKRLYRESIDAFRRVGMAVDAWPAINNLAGIAMIEGDTAGARRILENELDTFRQRDNPRALSFLLNNLGLIAYRAGDLEAALPVLEESVALAREMGYRSRLGYSLNVLGSIQLDRQQLAAAAATYREALAVAVDAQEAPLVPEVLVGIARVRLAQGKPAAAAAILRAVVSDQTTDEETRTSARSLLQPIDAAGETSPEPPDGCLDEIVGRLLDGGEPLPGS